MLQTNKVHSVPIILTTFYVLLIKKAREQFHNEVISADELRKVEDEEIKKLVAQQKEVGLETVTDGEFRRK